jgi:hypothetical protein
MRAVPSGSISMTPAPLIVGHAEDVFAGSHFGVPMPMRAVTVIKVDDAVHDAGTC